MEISTPHPTPQDLQAKLYFMLERLQEMARELPPKYQMRVPIELLSGLANSLLNNTVFEIVTGLMEIQHVTEEHLFNQRLQLVKQHAEELLALQSKNTCENDLKVVLERHQEELKECDTELVLQLDQKVCDQQSILEEAGVPGTFELRRRSKSLQNKVRKLKQNSIINLRLKNKIIQIKL